MIWFMPRWTCTEAVTHPSGLTTILCQPQRPPEWLFTALLLVVGILAGAIAYDFWHYEWRK